MTISVRSDVQKCSSELKTYAEHRGTERVARELGDVLFSEVARVP